MRCTVRGCQNEAVHKPDSMMDDWCAQCRMEFSRTWNRFVNTNAEYRKAIRAIVKEES